MRKYSENECKNDHGGALASGSNDLCPTISANNDHHFDNNDNNLSTHYYDPSSTPTPGCGPSPSAVPLAVYTHYNDPPRLAVLDDAPPTPPASPAAQRGDSGTAMVSEAVQHTDASLEAAQLAPPAQNVAPRSAGTSAKVRVQNDHGGSNDSCPTVSANNDHHFDNNDNNLSIHHYDPISTPLPGCGPSPSAAPLAVYTHYYDPPCPAVHPSNGPSPSIAPHPNNVNNDNPSHYYHDINDINPSPTHYNNRGTERAREVTESLV